MSQIQLIRAVFLSLAWPVRGQQTENEKKRKEKKRKDNVHNTRVVHRKRPTLIRNQFFVANVSKRRILPALVAQALLQSLSRTLNKAAARLD